MMDVPSYHDPKDPLLRTHVAAARLGVHLETLYRWIRAGHIAFVQPGRRRKLIRESEVNRLLAERRSVA